MAAIRIGIIGTGRHGARYANHIINDCDDVTLQAISRRSPIGKMQAETWQTTYFADWRELVQWKTIDAVIAATTPNLHEEIATACASAGKPLLLEKPLAVDAASAERIVKMFRDASLPLTVGHTLRFNTTVNALKNELYRTGELFNFYANQRLERIHHNWLDDPDIAGGGVILHTAVHLFDALRFITGREVKRIRATSRRHFNSNLENAFTAQVEMTNGLSGIIDAGKVGPARSGRYEFIGSEGVLQGDQVHDLLEFVHGNTISPVKHDNPISTIIPLLNGWRDHLEGKGGNPVPGQEGLEAIKICDACRDSAATDGWVEIK